MMKITYQLPDIKEVAKTIISQAGNKVLLFYGEMGAGKTTLIKEIAKQLLVEDVTSSPTFSIINEYRTHSGESLYHFDFYRINDENEVYQFGAEEYLDSGNWCFVEWPEKVENLLPLDAHAIRISINHDGTRSLEMK
ncbi:tRNA (adenosine(37)-N6)-threonylcarbamoyltransferase complex ATPase subunit type 1 TsaE [Namhaeicola litoreus]|uniref:tRNA threonylcarbamoyladenosine biosynthesis protein TsaE n=1 Tax=Namhaeicola litoreus TaxID=1052145 RepID=A0ABW3Y642_9FLAO